MAQQHSDRRVSAKKKTKVTAAMVSKGWKSRRNKRKAAKDRACVRLVNEHLFRKLERRYEIDAAYRPPKTAKECHNLDDLVRMAERDKKIIIEGDVICATDRGPKIAFFGHKKFIEAYKRNTRSKLRTRESRRKFRENFDNFASDSSDRSSFASRVGEDFVPLLGGPFNKQLYYYDFLAATSLAYHAWTHDALAKRIVQIIKYFVLGKGFRTDVEGKDEEKGQALWSSIEDVNDLEQLVEYALIELEVYGEILLRELPDGQTKAEYDLPDVQKTRGGRFPRYKLCDPSSCWEVITYPEDITRVLGYQFVFPTQFQTYTAKDKGVEVPSMKFIIEQIPAAEMLHYKINTVSNEKRGRSDLFCILGHLKRLRDTVTFKILSEQKNAAWSIDTTIKGNKADIDQYVRDQNRLGSIPDAAGEFVHTSAVTRQYLSAKNNSSGTGTTTQDAITDLIAAGSGVPTSYFGFHKSGGQTRASALVATEPVAKMFEDKQKLIRRLLTDMANRAFKKAGLDCRLVVTFPEIITQDRSQKLKDLVLATTEKAFSHERFSNSVAEEMDIDDYDYEQEMAKIMEEEANATDVDDPLNPLTDPGKISGGGGQGQQSKDPPAARTKPSAVTKNDRTRVKKAS